MAKAKKKKSIIKKKDEEKDLYLSFKFKLRPTRKQEQAFTKFVGHVLLLFKSGINLLTRFGKTNPINFDKI